MSSQALLCIGIVIILILAVIAFILTMIDRYFIKSPELSYLLDQIECVLSILAVIVAAVTMIAYLCLEIQNGGL